MWCRNGTKAKCKGGSFRIFGMSDSGFCSDIVALTSGMLTNCTAVLTINSLTAKSCYGGEKKIGFAS